jgi:hypothetical protein
VASPDRVARAALRSLEHPRKRTQVNASNYVIQFGFSAFPGLFDLLVGPLFHIAATDRTTPVAPNDGNVLASNEAGNRLLGGQGNPVVGVARNVAARVRSAAPRRGAA